MKVLSIGYGRNLFRSENIERQRLELCADAVESLEMIIFSKKTDNLSVLHTKTSLTLYPTQSASRLLMMLDAIKIGTQIIKKNPEAYLITTQDPFETGLIGWYLKLRFGRPLVIQMHADIYSKNEWLRESVFNYVRFVVGKYLLKKADTIRVVSERIKRSLLKQSLPITKIIMLPVAVDISDFISAVPNQIVRSLFSAEDFIFLSVGRFVTEKNYSLLIQSFKITYENNPKARLLLVGEGPLKTEIMSAISVAFPSGVVQVLPWSDDVPGLMKAADAYVLSSNYEGWARVLIEALGAGLPIVTTDVGCANEVVHSGEHGLVVPVGDVEALATAMTRLSTEKSFYTHCKDTIAALDSVTLPGANLAIYGQQWAASLHTSK
jgi:glycosyltransferase involved in cell wall biosynthesis